MKCIMAAFEGDAQNHLVAVDVPGDRGLAALLVEVGLPIAAVCGASGVVRGFMRDPGARHHATCSVCLAATREKEAEG